MIIGVPRETSPGENRVALVPDVVMKLARRKIDVLVEKDAGLNAGYSDEEFVKAGAKITDTKTSLFSDSKIVCSLNGPKIFDENTAGKVNVSDGMLYVSFMNPLANAPRMRRVADAKVTAFAMEMVPRISRAQAMDALSSQANLAGYKAVILAADRLKKILPMLMTAAGTIAPAKVLVLGAGVAGLQAIATAKRLGSVVYGYDIRDIVKEQIESLGGKFVKIKMEESGEGEGGYAKALSAEAQALQRKKLGEFACGMDVIISTAQIPGRTAPRLLDIDAVKAMKPSSVVVDLAAGSGGNIEGSKPDEDVNINGVTILGPTNLPSMLAYNASSMYAQNIASFLDVMLKEDQLALDFEDEIIKESCITHNGQIVNPRVLKLLEN